MKYVRRFETHQEYEAYVASDGYLCPNVSYCDDILDEVHYNECVEAIVVAKYYVTSTENPTKIGYMGYISGFSAIEIDGIKQPSVVSSYTFDTVGEHVVDLVTQGLQHAIIVVLKQRSFDLVLEQIAELGQSTHVGFL